MTETSMTESPLEVAAGTVGPGAIDAFELLGNETRLAILLALWEAYDPGAAASSVAFSELRERVGTPDSGQFNYHLGKLEGQFVDSTDDGYRLEPVGLKLVQTIIAGTGRGAAFEPTVIDLPCHYCGGATAVTYEDGWLYQICTECTGASNVDERFPDGFLFGEPFPPAALSKRSPRDIFAAGVFRLLQVATMKIGGLCPRCSGVVESSTTVCENHETSADELCSECGTHWQILVEWVCSVCKYQGGGPPSMSVTLHPAVVAFYHRRGIDIGYDFNDFERSKQVLTLMRNHEQELLSTDPIRIRVTIRHESDEMRLTLDEELSVVDTTVVE